MCDTSACGIYSSPISHSSPISAPISYSSFNSTIQVPLQRYSPHDSFCSDLYSCRDQTVCVPGNTPGVNVCTRIQECRPEGRVCIEPRSCDPWLNRRQTYCCGYRPLLYPNVNRGCSPCVPCHSSATCVLPRVSCGSGVTTTVRGDLSKYTPRARSTLAPAGEGLSVYSAAYQKKVASKVKVAQNQKATQRALAKKTRLKKWRRKQAAKAAKAAKK